MYVYVVDFAERKHAGTLRGSCGGGGSGAEGEVEGAIVAAAAAADRIV